MPEFLDVEFSSIGTLKHPSYYDASHVDGYTLISTTTHCGIDVSIFLSVPLKSTSIGVLDETSSMYCEYGRAQITDMSNFYPNGITLSHTQIVRDHRRQGFGTLWYYELARYGYTIVSDSVHMRGGKALWQKIVRDLPEDLIVGIYDTALKKWLCENYTPSSYPENGIWGDHPYDNIDLVLQSVV